MGTSTDAILFFGYCWDEEGWPGLSREECESLVPPSAEETWLPADDEEDDTDQEPELGAEKEYLRRKGLWTPVDYGQPTWGENQDLYRKLEAELPFEMVQHCHREYPMWGLAIRGTVTRAWRGHPKQIDPMDVMHPVSPSAAAKHDATLQEVCRVLRLKPATLGWWLVSDWS